MVGAGRPRLWTGGCEGDRANGLVGVGGIGGEWGQRIYGGGREAFSGVVGG